MSNITKLIILDDTAKDIRSVIKETSINIANAISINNNIDDRDIIYGFHIDSGESNPSSAVTYIEDAIGMTPVYMDYLNNRFNYGSWIDAFFMPRPCMVTYDGMVDYYLDPYDYEKKENGEVSDIGDPNTDYGVKYQGNAMMEWGSNNQQIWTKVVPDINDPYSGSVYISNKQMDDDYTAWPFINNQGRLVNHFYTAIYNGSLTAYTYDSNVYYRLRSIPRRPILNSPSGNASSKYIIPWEDDSEGIPDGFSNNTRTTHEMNLALNNNPNINQAYNASLIDFTDYQYEISWFTEVYCDIQLINNLLILIGKSLDTQEVFGNGNSSNAIGGFANGRLYSGSYKYNSDKITPEYLDENGKNVLATAGLFWGSSNTKYPVKVFGMENWWGNQWRRYAGFISKSSNGIYNYFIKNTFGTEDGSTVIGYNTNGTGYIDTLCKVLGSGGSASTSNIKNCKFINTMTNGDNIYSINSFFPSVAGGTSTQYYCDYIGVRTGTNYAKRGGTTFNGDACGMFYTSFRDGNTVEAAESGASLSFKPIKNEEPIYSLS